MYRKLRILNGLIALAIIFGGIALPISNKVYAFAGGNGTQGDPYRIQTAQHFANISTYPDGGAGLYFELINNITLPSNYSTIELFQGELNGNDYSINGLNKPLFDEVKNTSIDIGEGEFEFVGGVIRNISIAGNIDIHDLGAFNIGLLAGKAEAATIHDTYVSGSINVYSGSCEYIGGAIGIIEWSSVSNVTANVDVSAANCSSVGGLIGESFIDSLHQTAALGSVEGRDYVGGLIGYRSCSNDDGYITESFASGDVEGEIHVGGFIGRIAGNECHGLQVFDSYARGSVTGTEFVGGFVGSNDSEAISKAYSTGEVSAIGAENSGGFSGHIGGWTTPPTFSFWDMNTSGFLSSAGAEGMSTADMKDIYTYTGYLEGNDWDFESVWSISSNLNDGYPCLQWSEDSCINTNQLNFSEPVDKTVTAGQLLNIEDLYLIGNTSEILNINLYVNGGSLMFDDSTGLTFTGDEEGSNLQFSGSLIDINAALETLVFIAPDEVGVYTVEALVNGEDGGVVWFSNGHAYKVVNTGVGGINWADAKTAAENDEFGGVSGYLATITSQEEHDFILTRINESGWIGASDIAVEGVWRWMSGPESGQQFWQGNGNTGNAVNDMFENWDKTGANKEPNNANSNEHCAQIRFTEAIFGTWNDLNCVSSIPNYVVEFGAPGNLPIVVNTSFDITVIAAEPLEVTEFSPVNEATGVATDITALSFTFDRPVTLDYATAYLMTYIDEEEVYEFWGEDVTISEDGLTVTLHLWDTLDPHTRYYVEFDYEFAYNEEGTYFGGIWDKDFWNFRTTGPVPNDGDANNDGIQDREQDNVYTFLNTVNNYYVSLELPDTCSFNQASADAESTSTPDVGYNYPSGLVNFDATCSDEIIEVKVFQYGISADELVLRKHIPETNTYFTIEGATIETQIIQERTVAVATYTIVDNGELDLNPADGEISDPIGLGLLGVGVPNTGLGGLRR